jgi:hypothetical protein
VNLACQSEKKTHSCSLARTRGNSRLSVVNRSAVQVGWIVYQHVDMVLMIFESAEEVMEWATKEKPEGCRVDVCVNVENFSTTKCSGSAAVCAFNAECTREDGTRVGGGSHVV